MIKVSYEAKSECAYRIESNIFAAAILGWMDVEIVVREDFPNLFGNDPYECPQRPQAELDMQLFQLHLSRFMALFEDLKDVVDFYTYAVSWKSPVVSILSLCIYVTVCIKSHPAYYGNLPVGALIIFMLYRACIRRRAGYFVRRFVHRELEARRKAEKVSVDYDLHRPIGQVTVTLEAGQNLVSPELGIPGNAECRVYWDPARLEDTKYTSNSNKLTSIPLEICSTGKEFSQNPSWETITTSETTKRLKQTLSTQNNRFPVGETSNSKEVVFPLQIKKTN